MGKEVWRVVALLGYASYLQANHDKLYDVVSFENYISHAYA